MSRMKQYSVVMAFGILGVVIGYFALSGDETNALQDLPEGVNYLECSEEQLAFAEMTDGELRAKAEDIGIEEAMCSWPDHGSVEVYRDNRYQIGGGFALVQESDSSDWAEVIIRSRSMDCGDPVDCAYTESVWSDQNLSQQELGRLRPLDIYSSGPLGLYQLVVSQVNSHDVAFAFVTSSPGERYCCNSDAATIKFTVLSSLMDLGFSLHAADSVAQEAVIVFDYLWGPAFRRQHSEMNEFELYSSFVDKIVGCAESGTPALSLEEAILASGGDIDSLDCYTF